MNSGMMRFRKGGGGMVLKVKLLNSGISWGVLLSVFNQFGVRQYLYEVLILGTKDQKAVVFNVNR